MHQIIVLIICILLFAGIKKYKIEWCSPCGIYCILWGALCMFSVLYRYQNYRMSYYGIYWILCTCLFVLFVGRVVGKIKVPERSDNSSGNGLNVSVKALKRSLWIVTLLAFLKPILDVYVNGFSLFDFLNITKWPQISVALTEGRYSETLSYSLPVQILGVFMYLAPLIGGYTFALTKREKIFCFISFLPSLINVIITSAKIAAVSAVFTFFIGWVIGSVYRKRKSIRLSFSLIAKLAVCFVSVAVLFYLFMLWRTHDFSLKMQKIIFDKFVVYAFGQVYAFDYWFANGLQIGQFDLGTNTFLAVFNTLGLADRQQGVYEAVDMLSTNVFTSFRGLISDYGLIGASVFIVCFSATGQYLFKKLKSGQLGSIGTGLLGAIYYFILYSLIISPWIYTSYILVFILFGVIVKATRRVKRGSKINRNAVLKTNE